MTAKMLEEEAREAWINDSSVSASDDRVVCYRAGYLAAATARDKENAQLRTSLMLTGANFDSAVKEIEELRVKLEAVPVASISWGRDLLYNAANEHDHFCRNNSIGEPKYSERLREDAGNIDRWLATVTEPIPLPEGEG